jgi:hypothetical protein
MFLFFSVGRFDMGYKRGDITQKLLVDTADQMTTVAAAMADCAAKMSEAQMESISLPWVQVQWDAIDTMTLLRDHILALSPTEIRRWSQGRKTQGEIAESRKQSIATKRAAQRAAGDLPPKRRPGRPRKSAT